MNTKNRGIDWKRELAEQSEEDYVFGALSQKCIALIPEEEREKYLPVGELQRGREDFMSCATLGPINLLSTKFNWLLRNNKLSKENTKWLFENGYINVYDGIDFSDRFSSILAQTSRSGNSLLAPLKAIHTFGLIPKPMLPTSLDFDFAEYHDPTKITQEMKDLGQEFLKRFTINYERVYEEDFENLLKEDMLDVAGYAWPQPIDGIYPRVEYQPNHAFMNIRNKYFIFDNYDT